MFKVFISAIRLDFIERARAWIFHFDAGHFNTSLFDVLEADRLEEFVRLDLVYGKAFFAADDYETAYEAFSCGRDFRQSWVGMT